jgi:hypothetical protein
VKIRLVADLQWAISRNWEILVLSTRHPYAEWKIVHPYLLLFVGYDLAVGWRTITVKVYI